MGQQGKEEKLQREELAVDERLLVAEPGMNGWVPVMKVVKNGKVL